jgi:hypothetical protein
MRFVFFTLIAVAGILGCKKDKLGIESFWQCNQLQTLDTIAISSKLIGSWNWSKQICGTGAGELKTADKNIKVTFKTDHSFSVYESATLLTQGTWKLVQVDGSYWGVDLSSVSTYLYGRIFFCDNQVWFNNSYKDGCDNFFNKGN